MNRRSIAKVLNRYYQEEEIDGELKQIIDKSSEKDLINDLFALYSSSSQLKKEDVIDFDEYVNDNFTKRGNIYFSKCHKSGWFTIKEIKKMYKVEFNL